MYSSQSTNYTAKPDAQQYSATSTSMSANYASSNDNTSSPLLMNSNFNNYQQDDTSIHGKNISSSSNFYPQEQYVMNRSNFYDHQSNMNQYQSTYQSYNYMPYVESFSQFQYTPVSYDTSYMNSQPTNYQQIQPTKSLTPTPTTSLNTSSNGKADQTTPEKPIMNDSGIDIISPQLNFHLSQQQSMQLHQQQQLAMPSIQENLTHQNLAMSNSLSQQLNHIKANELENQFAAKQDDDVEEDEDDEEEDDEDEEEEKNKENKNKKSSSKTSKSTSPSKPPKPYLEIIAEAILSCNVKMMQLHEIYNVMEKKFEYFAKNINKSWRNSVRHNLSLNECFIKAGRGSNGKGNYWRIHPLCEKEFIRGNFRRKSFKQLIRAGNQSNSTFSSTVPPSSAYAYTIPFSEYSTNYKQMPLLLPPPLPQQFQSSNTNSNLNSFQYPFNSHQFQQKSNYPSQLEQSSHSYSKHLGHQN